MTTKPKLRNIAALSSEQMQHLHKVLQEEELLNVPERPPLQRVERNGSGLPLSYAQQRLWFIAQLEPESAAYNCPVAVRLKGELDLEALEKTINTIVERHESLRTHFHEVNGKPEQVIKPQLHIAVP